MNIAEQPVPVPILLVDDRPENLLSLEELLGGQNYELVRATCGNEALLLTLKHDFALVLLDVQMPEMDGFETAELMRVNPKTRNIPIIFVTAGLKDMKQQFKGYDSGAVDYLAKPIEPNILISKVRVFAELYRQRRELELHRNHLEELVEKRTSELQQTTMELKAGNERLQFKNRQLETTEELLRDQVAEFVETHDQLLATEEMLRVQIEEYQVAQQQLNESNRSLKTLFDVSPLAIAVSTYPGGVIREINHTFSDDFGYTEDSAVGRTGLEINLWTYRDERECFLGLVRNNSDVSAFKADINTAAGEIRHVLLYSTLMDYRNEKCLLIVFFDVTEQNRMEDQIRQTQKLDVIGQLAGGVAHDFNNMLTAILGSAELLGRHIKDIPAALKYLGSIQQAASRSAELTGQLLAFSRKGHKNIVQVNIDDLVHDVVSLLERTIDKKISLDASSVTSNSFVNGDPALLQNALLNLGVNARDAMPDGGVISFACSRVQLDAEFCRTSAFNIAPGPYTEISVSDSGVGMTREIMDHIFEPFFTTKEIGKGTGLGLAAVYGTVTEHSGCIDIFSEPGKGTSFKLYLPVSSVNIAPVTKNVEPIRSSGGVLLVDDEEIIRDVGSAMLEDLGYRVYQAADGIQALEVYERERDNITLVILDMLMPGMGGRETLLQLKGSYPDVCVLVSSGYHEDGTADDLKAIGARGFLQKPFSVAELSRAVSDALNRK